MYYKVAHRSQAELDSFADRYQVFDQTVIPTIFSSVMNLDVIRWEPSTSWGTSHVVFQVWVRGQSQPLIFRANLGISSPEGVMVVEQLITQQVSQLGLATNHVLVADASRKNWPFDFQIQEKMVGEDPEQITDWSQSEYDQLSFDLGAWIAQIQSLTYDNWGLFDESAAMDKGILVGTANSFDQYVNTSVSDDLSMLVEQKLITAQTSATIKRLFAESSQLFSGVRGCLVHHDLADHNIMVLNRKFYGAFDWEAGVIGDPVLDLASSPTWRTFYPREKSLLAGYQSVSQLPENFQDKYNLLKLRTMLWKMVLAFRIKIINQARIDKFADSLAPFHLSVNT